MTEIIQLDGYKFTDGRLARHRRVAEKKAKTREKYKRVLAKDDVALTERLGVLNRQIAELSAERAEIVKTMKERRKLSRQGRLSPVKLYALELEDDCWYVGMSFNPDRRFVRHKNGKGAGWTRLHPPVLLHEVRVTNFYDQDSVAKLEDDMTLEYALKYGSDKVRGGGWCQAKPRWPELITENERDRP